MSLPSCPAFSTPQWLLGIELGVGPCPLPSCRSTGPTCQVTSRSPQPTGPGVSAATQGPLQRSEVCVQVPSALQQFQFSPAPCSIGEPRTPGPERVSSVKQSRHGTCRRPSSRRKFQRAPVCAPRERFQFSAGMQCWPCAPLCSALAHTSCLRRINFGTHPVPTASRSRPPVEALLVIAMSVRRSNAADA